MARIGIWEAGRDFSTALAPILPPSTVSGNHPAAFSQVPFDLLLIAPSASGWAGAGHIDCRTVLLPGPFLPLARTLKAGSAISYGTAPKNTITLSSLEDGHMGVALQREIQTLSGALLEEQEFLLPFPPGEDPVFFLGLVGARLLLTGKP